MSELKGFNASELKAFRGSELLARGAIPRDPLFFETFLNSFELRAEIDKVEVWEYEVLNPSNTVLLKTLSDLDVFVFNNGLKHLFRYFDDADTLRFVWRNTVLGGMSRANQGSTPTNPNNGQQRGADYALVSDFQGRQSPTADGVVITFDGGSLGPPSGYERNHTFADNHVQAVSNTPITGIMLNISNRPQGKTGNSIFGIDFKGDTPGDSAQVPPTNAFAQEFHIFGRLYIESLT